MVSIENKRKRDRGNRASTLGVSYSNGIRTHQTEGMKEFVTSK